MAREFGVQAKIGVTDRASRPLQTIQGRFGRLRSFLADRFVVTLGDVARIVSSAIDVLGDLGRAAIAQEEAVTRLDAALSGLGPAAEQVSVGLQAQAAALQQVSTFGDEAIIEAQALLATLGVQADQIPRATQATVDLAAALGVDLQSAARNVGKTVGGFAGELGEVIPELRDLSAEALRSGEGIELLAQAFAGRASAQAETFSGRIAQVSNAFGDLQEALGRALTENEAVNASLENLSDTLSSEDTVALVEGLAVGLAKTAEAGLAVANAVPNAVAGIRALQNEIDATGTVTDAYSDSLANAADVLSISFGGAPGSVAVKAVQFLTELGSATRTSTSAAREAAIAEEALRLRREQGLGVADALAQAAVNVAQGVREATAATEANTAAALDNAAAQTDQTNAYGDLLRSLRDLGVSLDVDVNRKLEANETLLDRLQGALEDGAISANDYERATALIAAENEKLRAALEGLNPALAANAAGYGAVAAGAREAANATNEHSAAAEANAEATERQGGAFDTLLGQVRALGVSLDADLNQELQANEALLAELDLAYRRGAISANDYERATAAIASENTDLLNTLRDVNPELSTTERSYRDISRGAEEAARGTDRFTRSTRAAQAASSEFTAQARVQSQVQRDGSEDRSGHTNIDLPGGRFDFTQPRRVRVLPDGRIEVR